MVSPSLHGAVEKMVSWVWAIHPIKMNQPTSMHCEVWVSDKSLVDRAILWCYRPKEKYLLGVAEMMDDSAMGTMDGNMFHVLHKH
jgi:hypothetical protein